MSARIKTPCRGRTKSKCKKAKRSCKYVSGKSRKYCRTQKNRGKK